MNELGCEATLRLQQRGSQDYNQRRQQQEVLIEWNIEQRRRDE
jgi:hypothetical protein